MEEEKKKTKVTVKNVDQPSVRSNFSLCAHPEKDIFILFGGEFFNAGKVIQITVALLCHVRYWASEFMSN